MFLNAVKLFWVATIGGIVFSVLLIISINANWFGWYGGMPSLRLLENPKSELASEVISVDGLVLGKYYRENRSQVPYDSLSSNLINALRATEDVRFEEHSGIDLRSMLRVAWGIVTFNRQGGGSTLSQQLARNLFSTRSELHNGTLSDVPVLSTVIIKIKEWILATHIERAYTKPEIMTMYLNTVDFGSNAFGIKVAANTFFGVEPSELNVQEAAVLVGLLKAPTYYSPRYNRENSRRRRNTVLLQMQKYGYLTQAERDSIAALPIESDKYKVESHNTGPAPYFRAELAEVMREWCKNNKKPNGEPYDLYADGLKIYTTIDSRMQEMAEKAMRDHMSDQQEKFFNHWDGRNPWIDDDYKEIKGFLRREMYQTERYKTLKKQYGDQTDSINWVLNEPREMYVFSWEDDVEEVRETLVKFASFKKAMDTYNADSMKVRSLDSGGFEVRVMLSPMDSLAYYKHFLQTGMMTMDPNTGHIKTWVGGINFKHFKYDHVRRALRQPGSTFKPVIYSAAIEDKKLHPCYKVVDAPITFTLDDGTTWTPKNSEEYTGQTYTLRQAMALSKNTAAVYLMKELGPERVVDYAVNKFGIGYLRSKYNIPDEIEQVYSLALGTSRVSVMEMVGAYGVFPNHGVWTEPVFITRIEDKDGKVLETFVPKTIEALSEETAYIMTYMLRGSNEERGGTSISLRSRGPYEDRAGYDFIRNMEVGGKTGTTTNYSDGWFMGVTKNLVTGVWVGAEDNVVHFRSLTYGQGARMAMPAFANFTEAVYKNDELPYIDDIGENGEFEKPNTSLPEFNCWKYEQLLKSVTDSTQSPVPATEDDFF